MHQVPEPVQCFHTGFTSRDYIVEPQMHCNILIFLKKMFTNNLTSDINFLWSVETVKLTSMKESILSITEIQSVRNRTVENLSSSLSLSLAPPHSCAPVIPPPPLIAGAPSGSLLHFPFLSLSFPLSCLCCLWQIGKLCFTNMGTCVKWGSIVCLTGCLH